MKPTLLVAWAVAWVASAASPAAGHAFLDHAIPAVGSTIHGPPPRVELWFTTELEPAFSTVRVIDQGNHRQDKGDATVDPRDHKLMQVTLPTLAPGRYRVEWRVLSVDTHVTTGDFTFVVAP
jgi:methionine-rich copper-binding protein CopC